MLHIHVYPRCPTCAMVWNDVSEESKSRSANEEKAQERPPTAGGAGCKLEEAESIFVLGS